jgi:hypothetical protein
MWDVHDSTLGPDGPRRFLRLQTRGYAFAEKQADDLSCVCAQLLADDHTARQPIDEIDRTFDGVVIGDAQHVDPRIGNRSRDLVGCCRRIAAPHRVAVHVDSHPTRRQRFSEMWMTSDG